MSGPARFRKKPVVIEAVQMTLAARYDNKNWPEWLNRAWNAGVNDPGAVYPLRLRPDAITPFLHPTEQDLDDLLVINTREGHHVVSIDDWVIRGIQGELYPCKPDIFAATYEPVICGATMAMGPGCCELEPGHGGGHVFNATLAGGDHIGPEI